jgi:hypothetical protein
MDVNKASKINKALKRVSNGEDVYKVADELVRDDSRDLPSSTSMSREAEEAKSSGKALLAKATRWDEISIEVVDDHTVKYKVSDGNWKRLNYSEFGFQDERRGLPNKLWTRFLEMAAHCSGEYINMSTPTNISKDIDRICKTLKEFFGPNDRPILYNKKNKNWKVAFRLTYKIQDNEISS